MYLPDLTPCTESKPSWWRPFWMVRPSGSLTVGLSVT